MNAITTMDLKPVDPKVPFYIHPSSRPLAGHRKIYQYGYAWVKGQPLPIAVAILQPRRSKDANAFKRDIHCLRDLQKLDPAHLYTPKLYLYSSKYYLSELGICDFVDLLSTKKIPSSNLLRKPQMLVGFARQILHIGIFFHKAGLAHRDMKLENLLIARNRTGQFRAIAIDFDTMIPFTHPDIHRFVGTDAYDAPETIRAKILKQKSLPIESSAEKRDCWSFGLVIHQVLAQASAIINITKPWLGRESRLLEMESTVEAINAVRLRTIEMVLADKSDPLGLICLDPNLRFSMVQAEPKFDALIKTAPRV